MTDFVAGTNDSRNETKPCVSRRKKEDALVVVAIDFGTSFSGYAYTLKDNSGDEHKIYNKEWQSGELSLGTPKTPTAILLKANGEFVSFGYDAQTKYFEMLENEDLRVDEYCFFQGYKMTLFQNEGSKAVDICKDAKVNDMNGNPMKAITVFSQSIKFFKDHFLNSAKIRHFAFEDEDIHWVLTVPAIWTDVAKQFMAESAKEAGIRKDFLTLAYEPEVAAICCRQTIVKTTDKEKLQSFEPGHKFMVVDCGGGTVDITTYEVLTGSVLRQITKPCGGNWGGDNVNKEYIEFLSELFGREVWKSFVDTSTEDFMSVMKTFEAKKRFSDESKDLIISYPILLINEYEKIAKRKFDDIVLNIPTMNEFVEVRRGHKLRIKVDKIKQFFTKSVEAIVNKVNELLNLCKKEGHNIKSILMVGGYSESPILYSRVKDVFGGKHSIICPPDGVASVMKGAVMFGRNPDLISERICPRTYGISVDTLFDNRKHPISLKSYSGRLEVCTDVFRVMVEEDARLIVGKSDYEFECNPTRPDDTEVLIEVFSSDHKHPMYTMEKGVTKLGVLLVPIVHSDQTVKVKMYFGFTELYVTAEVEGSNHKTEITFDCMFK